MAPKNANSKKEQGRAKKAENEDKKKAATAADKERKEAEEWSKGAKNTAKAKEEKEAKKAADAARKAENARLLAEEEAEISTKKPAQKPTKGAGSTAKKSIPASSKPAGPGAIAAGGGLASIPDPLDTPSTEGQGKEEEVSEQNEEAESYSATGLDDALEMMTLVTAKTDKASVGQQAAKLEAHPERRFKAAFESYLERELPSTRKEHPGLRLVQYRELLFKQFQKAPENPFNQALVSYNATNEDKVATLKAERERAEERLRSKD